MLGGGPLGLELGCDRAAVVKARDSTICREIPLCLRVTPVGRVCNPSHLNLAGLI